MRMPTLHDKLLELYVKKENPDMGSLKRALEKYFHRKYPEKKLERLILSLNDKHDFLKEAEDIKRRNHLSAYIDSIVLSRIRDSFNSSKSLNIDELEELKFKSLVKQVILHFGYEMLFMPKSNANGIDIIVHRGDVKVAVLAVKCASDSNIGSKTVRHAKYIADYYHCEEVLLISSGYFEDEASKDAAEIGVTLLDRDKFLPLVQDLIDNKQRKEKEYLISGLENPKKTIFLDGQVKSPRTKVQAVFVKYYVDDLDDSLNFEGELLNTGKRPVSNLTVEIRIFGRTGECILKKSAPIEKEKLDSKEKESFKLIFDEILESDWSNICRYELKLEYSNVYTVD